MTLVPKDEGLHPFPQGLTAPPGGGCAPPGEDWLLPGAVGPEPVLPVKWTSKTITTTITTRRVIKMISNRRVGGLALPLDGGGVTATQPP
jgi:hypothetical protein